MYGHVHQLYTSRVARCAGLTGRLKERDFTPQNSLKEAKREVYEREEPPRGAIP